MNWDMIREALFYPSFVNVTELLINYAIIIVIFFVASYLITLILSKSGLFTSDNARKAIDTDYRIKLTWSISFLVLNALLTANIAYILFYVRLSLINLIAHWMALGTGLIVWLIVYFSARNELKDIIPSR